MRRRNSRRFKRAALALSLAASAAPARAVEYLPIYNFSLLGGQYFFAGDRTRLNGNVSARVAPVMKFSEQWSLLPIYSGDFRGTKAVTDAVGSSSLFQQGMDQRVSLGGLYSAPESDWKHKPSISYKHGFLKETRDEAWAKGLFDTQTFGVGFESEYTYLEPFSYRFGYDFFFLRFPNYSSLESSAGVDPNGNPLGRETAGTRVLDTFNQQLSFTATQPIPYANPKVSFSGSYRLLWQKWPDQPLINLAGQPVKQNRQDFTHSWGAGVAYPAALSGGALRLNSSFNAGLAYNGSNQNTFDAKQTQFVSDSYSSLSFSAGPGASFSWGDKENPVSAGAAFSWSRTRYLGRLVQETNGIYRNEKQYQDRYLFALSYGYPIAPNFRLNAQANVLFARSNMRFEQTYKYNYSTANYLFGFTYDY